MQIFNWTSVAAAFLKETICQKMSFLLLVEFPYSSTTVINIAQSILLRSPLFLGCQDFQKLNVRVMTKLITFEIIPINQRLDSITYQHRSTFSITTEQSTPEKSFFVVYPPCVVVLRPYLVTGISSMSHTPGHC